MIYVGFESILVQEENEKQNPKEYQKYIACSYGYNLVHVDDKFSKPFKTYLGKDAVYSFINNIIMESNSCSEVMKKHFKEGLVLTKEDKDFKNSTICWICGNDYVDNYVKARDHGHITGRYEGSEQRDCNINLKLNLKILVLFHNLKKYDSHLVMEEVDKFNLMINVIPNELEKYMSFNINNNLGIIDSFKFLCSLLELDNNVLVRGKQSYDYMSDFETFQEELLSKENFFNQQKNYCQRILTCS